MSLHRDDHLGEYATALVDGALDHETRDVALAHLARCADCRGRVEAERRLKGMLRGAPDPGMPPDLFNQLLDIGRVTGRGRNNRSGGERSGVVPWVPEMARFGRSAAALAGSGRRGSRGSTGSGGSTESGAVGPAGGDRRPGGSSAPPNRSTADRAHGARRTRRIVGRVAGGVAVLAIGVGVLVVTLPHDSTAPVTPAVATFTVQHAATTGDVPGADPATGAVVKVSTGR